jgi:preprotein translocase subunit YajC
MNKKRIRLSPVELTLVLFMLLSLVLSFLQTRQEERRRKQLAASRARS